MLRTDKTALSLVLAVLLIPLTVCFPLYFISAETTGTLSWSLCFGVFAVSIIGGAYLMRAIVNRVEERVSHRRKRRKNG